MTSPDLAAWLTLVKLGVLLALLWAIVGLVVLVGYELVRAAF